MTLYESRELCFRCTRWFSIRPFLWLMSFAWRRTVSARLWSMFVSARPINGHSWRELKASIKPWSIWRSSVPIFVHFTSIPAWKKKPLNKSIKYILIWKSREPVNFFSPTLRHISSFPKIWTICSVEWTQTRLFLYDMYSVYFLLETIRLCIDFSSFLLTVRPVQSSVAAKCEMETSLFQIDYKTH